MMLLTLLVVAPESLQVTYLRALIPGDDFHDANSLLIEEKKDEDEEDLKEKQENMKDIQENPYVKSPKRPKIR